MLSLRHVRNSLPRCTRPITKPLRTARDEDLSVEDLEQDKGSGLQLAAVERPCEEQVRGAVHPGPLIFHQQQHGHDLQEQPAQEEQLQLIITSV